VQVLPEDNNENEGLCPICDSKVALDATKCPECRADLSLFGVKKEGEAAAEDIDVPDEESIEALLGEITDGTKGSDLFDEIMAAVDKSDTMPAEQTGEPIVDEKIEEVVEEAAEIEALEQAPEPAPEAVHEPVMFECPLCNTLVSEDASTCPGCGAIFAESEEAVEEQPQQEVEAEPDITEAAYEPESVEPAPEVAEPKKRFKFGKKKKDKAKPVPEPEPEPTPEPEPAPQVAPQSEEKALRQELTRCVSEVKPLLAGSRQFGINVMEGRKLIDKAIVAGKQRDFANAINLVKESQRAILTNFVTHVEESKSQTQSKIDALKKAGGDTGDLENMLVRVQALVDKNMHIEAAKMAKTTSAKTEEAIMKYKSVLKDKKSDEEKDVTEKVRNLVDLIKSGEEVKVNVKGTKNLLTQARLAIKKNEWNQAETYLNQAKDDFLKELPKQITDIISNSKPMLYKAKMQGVDIRPSIKLLKEASTALKLNNYIDALDAIKRYRTEMNQYIGES
jgi:hypothetical protein